MGTTSYFFCEIKLESYIMVKYTPGEQEIQL